MDDEQNYKHKLLAETRADIFKRQLSNAENYDKAIISLSTVFLGFSFAYLKDFVAANNAVLVCLLYGSWFVLTGSIAATILSFWLSQIAINEQLKRAEDYYLNSNTAALRRSNSAKATDWINVISGIFFILGILFTTIFIVANFERRLAMGGEQKTQQVILKEGAPVPKMQEVPLVRGAPVPNLQSTPQTQPPQTQPPAQATSPKPGTGDTSTGDTKK